VVAEILVEMFFLGAIGVSFVSAIAILFFINIIDRIFVEEIYEKSFLAFELFITSILLHMAYHISGDILSNHALETSFEVLSFILFLAGVIIITRATMKTQISYEAHIGLQEEVRKKTKDLEKYTSELESSNRIKDLFTDIMSHDLLNPVGVIMNYADILTSEEETFDKNALKVIKRNAEKSVEMIQSASTFSKLEKMGDLEFQDLELGKMVKDEITDIEPRAASRKMKINHKITGKYPVRAASFLSEVFSNLLTNAIKYSPEGSAIDVFVRKSDDYWRVEIRDRGVGVEDQYKKSIFKRFERHKKEGVKGTGLGLAIVDRVVAIHKGRVWVEDNPGGGSVFIVLIPRAKQTSSA